MRCLWTGEWTNGFHLYASPNTNCIYRYEVSTNCDDWSAAEAQVNRTLAKSGAVNGHETQTTVPTVSVRSDKVIAEKRKSEGDDNRHGSGGKAEKRRKGPKGKR